MFLVILYAISTAYRNPARSDFYVAIRYKTYGLYISKSDFYVAIRYKTYGLYISNATDQSPNYDETKTWCY
jgi:hypothetical protein